MRGPSYPEDRQAWRDAIDSALALSRADAEAALRRGDFPYARLARWLRSRYRAEAGYSPEFVPALLRNVRGLVAWVYGGGSEPYWPGRDHDARL